MKKKLTVVAALSMWSVLALAASGSSPAPNVPIDLPTEGYLLDQSGKPVTGTTSITFTLWDAPTGGNAKWTDTRQVNVDNGQYALVLGDPLDSSAKPLAADDLAAPRFLGITIDGQELMPRLEVGSVPYAVEALNAQNLSGGTITGATITNSSVDATSVSVGGTPVIDSSGQFLGTAHDAENLGGQPASDYLTKTGDGSGLTNLNPQNIASGTASIDISGNAATATTAKDFSGTLTGDVTGTQHATVVSGLQGVSVSSTAPSALDVLRYDATTKAWIPSNDVASFKGRTGYVMPAAGDYHFDQITGQATNSELAGPLVESLVGDSSVSVTNPENVVGPATVGVVLDGSTLEKGANGIGINLGNADSWTGAQTFSGGATISQSAAGKDALDVTSADGSTKYFAVGPSGDVSFSGAVTAKSFNGTVAPTSLSSGTAGIDITGNAATVTNGVYTTGSYPNPSWLTSLAGSKVTGNISGDAANVTGVVQIANGGTGSSTKSFVDLSTDQAIAGTKTFSSTIGGSITGNAATVTNGVYTSGSYPNPSWLTSLAGSKVTGDISGNATNVTGIVQIANGGTGSSTKSFVDLSTDQTIAGTKTFSAPIAGSITGNAATVTNGIYTTGSYPDPSWLTSLAGSKVTGNITGDATNVTGIVQIANGGTGSSTKSFVDLSTDQTIAGTKTFSAAPTFAATSGAPFTVSSTSAAKVANLDADKLDGLDSTGFVQTGQTYSNPTWLTGIDGSKVTGNINGDAANVTGVVAIAQGGTGATSAAAARTSLGLGALATQNTVKTDSTLTGDGVSTGLGLSLGHSNTWTAGQTFGAGAVASATADQPSLIVKQTTATSPASNVFEVDNASGAASYFDIDHAGNAKFSGGVTAPSFQGSLATSNLSGTVANNQLANSSLTIGTASGSGLAGGGNVSLGNSLSLSIPAGGVTNTMLAGPVVSGVSAGAGLNVTGSPASGTSAATVGLAASGVTAGTYTKVTVDQYGRATSATSLTSGDVTSALTFTPLSNAGGTLTGPLGVETTSTSVVPLTVDLPFGQTSDLTDWQVAGTNVASMDKTGSLTVPGLAVNGTATVSGLTVNGAATASSLTVTAGAAANDILTSDASGNATWTPPSMFSGESSCSTSSCSVGTNRGMLLDLDTGAQSVMVSDVNANGVGNGFVVSLRNNTSSALPLGPVAGQTIDGYPEARILPTGAAATLFVANGKWYSYGASIVAGGEWVETFAGTYTWTVPSGVTSVSIVAVGAGGGGGTVAYGGGGGGGQTCYANNVTVSAGNSFSITVGVGGSGTGNGGGTVGGDTRVSRAGFVLVAHGGAGAPDASPTTGGPGGDGVGGYYGVVCHPGGSGGNGYLDANNNPYSGGGGGAGGYDGGGGNGEYADHTKGVLATSGTGGGGGGGGAGDSACIVGTGGGGVGLYGIGPDGAAGSYYAYLNGLCTPGFGGSGGANGVGTNSDGGPGGGGGGGNGGLGGSGAVRIIWGVNASFPFRGP